MTSFSQTTGYAIEALACLARSGEESMLVREIAESTTLPLPYLAKVFNRLSESGIVESKRGYKGGVKLARPPETISLLEINSAVEATKVASHDTETQSPPVGGSRFWDAFQQSYREKLKAMTLADVLAAES